MEQKEALLKNLRDTIAFLKEISVVEEEKFQATAKNQIFIVEECIKKEQALLLHSKGLDQKREQLQKEMGIAGQTLRQFIEALPDAERPPFQEAFEALSAEIASYQEIHHRTKTMIEVNLHRINRELERMTGNPSGGNIGYAEHGEMPQKHKPLTSRKI